jgi:hypothetical protein
MLVTGWSSVCEEMESVTRGEETRRRRRRLLFFQTRKHRTVLGIMWLNLLPT